jgi:hypothetical protein
MRPPVQVDVVLREEAVDVLAQAAVGVADVVAGLERRQSAQQRAEGPGVLR